MARVRNIEPEELAPDLAAIYREFAGVYGPFRNQVAVFAHVPRRIAALDGTAARIAGGRDAAETLS